MRRLILNSVNLIQPVVVHCEFEKGPRACIWIQHSDPSLKEQRGKFYWRMVGKDNQDLLNFDLMSEDGELFTIELLVYTKTVLSATDLGFEMNEMEMGIPLFDVSAWPKGVKLGPDLYDVFETFRVSVGPAFLRLTLFDERVSRRLLVAKKLVCEFNEKAELCGIVVLKMSAAERALISSVLPEARKIDMYK